MAAGLGLRLSVYGELELNRRLKAYMGWEQWTEMQKHRLSSVCSKGHPPVDSQGHGGRQGSHSSLHVISSGMLLLQCLQNQCRA